MGPGRKLSVVNTNPDFFLKKNFSGFALGGDNLPSFHWAIGSEQFPPPLTVRFPDGGEDSVVFMRHNPIPPTDSESPGPKVIKLFLSAIYEFP
jgi:hypothetical protein